MYFEALSKFCNTNNMLFKNLVSCLGKDLFSAKFNKVFNKTLLWSAVERYVAIFRCRHLNTVSNLEWQVKAIIFFFRKNFKIQCNVKL